MRSHLSLILSHRDARWCVTPTRPLKTILAIHGEKLIRILLSRTTAREKRRENLLSKRAAYGATSGAALSYGFWSFRDERGRRSWVYLTLIPPPRPWGFSSRMPAPRPTSSFRRDLTHETSYNPSFYPSVVPRSCLSESRNDYRYGRRWPNIRVNPSVEH